MRGSVSTLEIRARLGDVLNRVDLLRDEFIIERKGRPMAALVPVTKLEQIERYARRHATELLDLQSGGSLTQEEAEGIARAAVRFARRKRTK
ncbi:MAG: type II toxin-antitoxin system prevent-host-death family antitoxin [Acidobacteriota bacterium]